MDTCVPPIVLRGIAIILCVIVAILLWSLLRGTSASRWIKIFIPLVSALLAQPYFEHGIANIIVVNLGYCVVQNPSIGSYHANVADQQYGKSTFPVAPPGPPSPEKTKNGDKKLAGNKESIPPPPPPPPSPQFLIEKYRPHEVAYGCEIIPSEKRQTVKMAGKTFTNGIVLTACQSNGFALINIDRERKIIRYTVGHVDGSEIQKKLLQIYFDGKFYKEYELRPESGPTDKEIKVEGVQILAFVLKNIDPGLTSNAEFGLMNMTVE